MKNKLLWLAGGLIVFSIVMRLLPHAPNIAPVGALALFAGFYFSKRWGLLTPLVAMFVSDIFIGFYDMRLMAVVYGSFLIMVLLGQVLRDRRSFFTVILGVIGGSVMFFLTTNFAVWAFSSWYPHTLDGILLCYTMALPFFRNSLLGDFFYSGVFFGLYTFIPVFICRLKRFFSAAVPALNGSQII